MGADLGMGTSISLLFEAKTLDEEKTITAHTGRQAAG
jgi:hypothetical protein